MSYSDPKWYSDLPVEITPVGTTTFGAVASAGVATLATLGGAAYKAFRGMNLQGGSVGVIVAPGTTMQPCTVAVMDGTTTLATAVVTTLTAGQNIALTTGATVAVTAADALTVEVYGTATASVAAGQNSGQYLISCSFNRQFA